MTLSALRLGNSACPTVVPWRHRMMQCEHSTFSSASGASNARGRLGIYCFIGERCLERPGSPRYLLFHRRAVPRTPGFASVSTVSSASGASNARVRLGSANQPSNESRACAKYLEELLKFPSRQPEKTAKSLHLIGQQLLSNRAGFPGRYRDLALEMRRRRLSRRGKFSRDHQPPASRRTEPLLGTRGR